MVTVLEVNELISDKTVLSGARN